MVKTLGVVEVYPHVAQVRQRPPSGGLAGRRFAGYSLLEWVVRRMSEAQQLDRVVVLGDVPGQRLAGLVPPDVSLYDQPAADPLARFAAAVRYYGAQQVVRVRVGSPFLDPMLVDRLVTVAATHPGCDYIGYCSRQGSPSLNRSLGMLAEWCCGQALDRADRLASDPLDRQDATRYLYSHPEWFQLRLVPLPQQLDRDDLRLAVHVEEDWDHAHAIVDALGPEQLDWQCIAALLDQQPAMRRRMAVLNEAQARVS